VLVSSFMIAWRWMIEQRLHDTNERFVVSS
jgi:hypothetical protein